MTPSLTDVIAEAIFNVLFDESMSAKTDTAELATKAALKAINQAGYVCVPKEPSPEMILAANAVKGDAIGEMPDYQSFHMAMFRAQYCAMLSASKEG